MPRVLRNTSQAFKSYIDILGTPFPQDRPSDFVEWLSEQLSVDIRPTRQRFNGDYRSLEALLKAVERAYSGLGLELLVSGGASGRMAVIPRDKKSSELALQSFHLSFQRYLGLKGEHSALLLTPQRTRSAVDRMTRNCLQQTGVARGQVHFACSFSARPDQVRVRTGLTYHQGWRGLMEKYLAHPLATTFQARLVDPRAMETVVSRLVPAGAHGEKVLLLGSPSRLHTIAMSLLGSGRTITLVPGSMLATAGGADKVPAQPAAELRRDLQAAFRLSTGEPAPIHDIYGTAEANWAAVQCVRGNYHIPPWVYAATLDDQDALQTQARSTGQFAFYDPLGGGDLFPAFFRTADEATLVRGDTCPCGGPGCYLEQGSIRDLSGEARCPRQE
jgi:hypothetical protein